MTARAELFVLIPVICLQGVNAMAAEGLITLRSNYDPKDTIDRLEAAMKAKCLTVFAHVDDAAGAAVVGLSLGPTDLLIFGNARGGTALMESIQTIGVAFAAENSGLAGRRWQHLAFLQRSPLARGV